MSVGAALVALIPEAVRLGMDIAEAIAEHRGIKLGTDEWKALGPEVQALVEKAVSGEDISHEELMQHLPSGDLPLRVLQLQKKAERIAQDLPV